MSGAASSSSFLSVGLVRVFLTSTGNYTVPSNWQNTVSGPLGFANKIECLGGGYPGSVNGEAPFQFLGGGGGGYSATTNMALTASGTVPVTIGNPAVGFDTTFSGASAGGSTVEAKGGFTNLGGQATSGVGSLKFSGGGGDGAGSAGGGGAAGPNGNGTNASGSVGGSGDAGFGGAGGTNAPGGNGTEWDASHGSGGGAGTNGTIGHNGGLYGGGGSFGTSTNGNGTPGLIVVSYYPS